MQIMRLEDEAKMPAALHQHLIGRAKQFPSEQGHLPS